MIIRLTRSGHAGTQGNAPNKRRRRHLRLSQSHFPINLKRAKKPGLKILPVLCARGPGQSNSHTVWWSREFACGI
jgi:hypothetical protein